jgi:GntR family transcriptional regulator / MocR family aminotransferase
MDEHIDSSRSGQMQVYTRLLDAIRSGELAAGARVPSARVLAQRWGVARGAVDEACARLVRDGLVQRRVGRGSFVVDMLPMRAAAVAAKVPPLEDETGYAAALRPLATDIASFPLHLWRRHLARALRDDAGRDRLSYGLPAGTEALREATARHLRLTRSIDCSAQQVIILSSALLALDLIAQVLLAPGDRVCVEDPGFPDESQLLAHAHLNVVPVPVDEQGFDAAAAQALAPDAAAILLHPLNQYPTGWRTTPERRRALLEFADSSGSWIIEGDHLAEIVYDGAAPPALWRSDRHARVLYVGTYNGVMFPSLRLAYLVVPEPLAPAFTAVRGMLGDHSPVLQQTAMASFMEAGQLSARLRGLRSVYGTRRLALLNAAQRHLGGAYPLGPTGTGVHVCLPLPASVPDVPLAARLATQGVQVQALSTLCQSAPRPGQHRNGLVLGYGASEAAHIDQAVQTIAAGLVNAAAARA